MRNCNEAASRTQRAKFAGRHALLGACASLLLSACAGGPLDDLIEDILHGSGGGSHQPPPQEPPPGASCDVTWDQVYEALEADILGLDAEERPFVRYVTLANKLVAGECGAALLDDRQQLGDLVLSLSQQSPAAPPQLIGGDTETFRIDLRDYGLSDADGPFVANGTSFVDGWEAIAGNTPYAVEFQGDQAENVILLAGTLSPVLFLDALADGASRAGLPVNDPDPIADVLEAFDEDVDLATVAGDTLFPDELLAREIPRLDPALSGLDDGFSVDRDDWSALYVNTLCIVTVANENRPVDAVCQ
jgi:hypothetical protein